MQRLVRLFIERRPFLSPFPIALSFLLGLMIRPLLIFNASMISLVALSCDRKEVSRAIAGSLVIVAFFSFLLSLGPSTLLFALGLWLPAASAAVLHRAHRDFYYSFLTLTVFVFIYLCFFRLSVESVQIFWTDRVTTFLSNFPVTELNLSEAELVIVSGQVHIWSILLIQFFLISSLLISRWYQSKLYNPGGFSQEFLSFKLPKFLALLLTSCLLLNVLEFLGPRDFSVLGDISVMLMGLFFFHGLSVIHFTGRENKLARGWFTALYILVLLLPQLVGLVIIITGILDCFINLRNRTSS
tara:strand:- start:6265 stop:7161 length:897 start_codon:yes stop_codon:yes gene_type:complete